MLFFKQKTAYEMRISDWSSDVCSSDLIADRVIADMPHVQLAARVREHRQAVVLLLPRLLLDLKRMLLSPERLGGLLDNGRLIRLGHGNRQRQNGRASCRERVCQDV